METSLSFYMSTLSRINQRIDAIVLGDRVAFRSALSLHGHFTAAICWRCINQWAAWTTSGRPRHSCAFSVGDPLQDSIELDFDVLLERPECSPLVVTVGGRLNLRLDDTVLDGDDPGDDAIGICLSSCVKQIEFVLREIEAAIV